MTTRISTDIPFAYPTDGSPWQRGIWPVRWLRFPDETPSPALAAFRLKFSIEAAARVRVHVSADERYELWHNGVRIGRGLERSIPDFWAFDSYELDLPAGENVLVARVQKLGRWAPSAQLSSAPGFLLAADDEWLDVLGTGRAAWDVKTLGGVRFDKPEGVLFIGSVFDFDGAQFDWDFERGESEDWTRAVAGDSVTDEGFRPDFLDWPILRPAALPPQLSRRWTAGSVRYVAPFAAFPTSGIAVRDADSSIEDVAAWQKLWDAESNAEEPIEIAAHTRVRVLVDLENYVCAYPLVEVSGGRGALLRWHWQEALLEKIGTSHKGQRDEIEGKFFATPADHGQLSDGIGDVFRPDGGAHRLFETLHWRCGRFVEICIETGDAPLTIHRLQLEETRYPLENESRFEASDARLAAVIPIFVRVLQMCSHETYMDCPFYEQLQYIGDTRLIVLTNFVMTRDDALSRQALHAFDRSRLVGGSGNGLTQSRAPSHVRQVIPPFSLWYVAMVYDYAMWRDEPALIRELLSGVRAVLDAFRRYQNADGLLEALPGWNFADWVRDGNQSGHTDDVWPNGIPPQGNRGVSAIFNWQFALVLRLASEVESARGDELLAQRNLRDAETLAAANERAFWNEERGLWADDLSHEKWSEHTQCLAILSGLAAPQHVERAGRNLVEADDLARTTIYFSHYLFETYRVLDLPGALMNRLQDWLDLPSQGFSTTPEQPEPSRSDCHAWGAHPLFHYHATILGVRPSAHGFARVHIAPQLGALTSASGTIPHPRGEITVRFESNEETWRAEIDLPLDVSGELQWRGVTHALRAGHQVLHS